MYHRQHFKQKCTCWDICWDGAQCWAFLPVSLYFMFFSTVVLVTWLVLENLFLPVHYRVYPIMHKQLLNTCLWQFLFFAGRDMIKYVLLVVACGCLWLSVYYMVCKPGRLHRKVDWTKYRQVLMQVDWNWVKQESHSCSSYYNMIEHEIQNAYELCMPRKTIYPN